MEEKLETRINEILQEIEEGNQGFRVLLEAKKKPLEDLLEQERGAFDESSAQVVGRVDELGKEFDELKSSFDSLTDSVEKQSGSFSSSLQQMEEQLRQIESRAKAISEAHQRAKGIYEELGKREEELSTSFNSVHLTQEKIDEFLAKQKALLEEINSLKADIEQAKESASTLRQRLSVISADADDRDRSIRELFEQDASKRNEAQSEFRKSQQELESRISDASKRLSEISEAIGKLVGSEMYRVMTSMTLEQYLNAVASGVKEIILREVRESLIDDVISRVETEKSGVFGHKLQLQKKSK